MKLYLLQKNGKYELTPLVGEAGRAMTHKEILSHIEKEGYNIDNIDLEIYSNGIFWLNDDTGQIMGTLEF